MWGLSRAHPTTPGIEERNPDSRIKIQLSDSNCRTLIGRLWCLARRWAQSAHRWRALRARHSLTNRTDERGEASRVCARAERAREARESERSERRSAARAHERAETARRVRFKSGLFNKAPLLVVVVAFLQRRFWHRDVHFERCSGSSGRKHIIRLVLMSVRASVRPFAMHIHRAESTLLPIDGQSTVTLILVIDKFFSSSMDATGITVSYVHKIVMMMVVVVVMTTLTSYENIEPPSVEKEMSKSMLTWERAVHLSFNANVYGHRHQLIHLHVYLV